MKKKLTARIRLGAGRVLNLSGTGRRLGVQLKIFGPLPWRQIWRCCRMDLAQTHFNLRFLRFLALGEVKDGGIPETPILNSAKDCRTVNSKNVRIGRRSVKSGIPLSPLCARFHTLFLRRYYDSSQETRIAA